MMTASPKDVIRKIFEQAWNRQVFDGLEPVLADEIQMHFRGQSSPTNLADLKQLVAAWRSAFPDLHFVVEDMIEEGDRVAVRLTLYGPHQGAWKGAAPTGRAMRVSEMMFFRFEGGQLVEMWEDYDEFGLWQQLGAAPGHLLRE